MTTSLPAPMPVVLEAAMRSAPNDPGLTVDKVTWTRQELFDRVTSFAHAFREQGVAPGRIVSILLPTSHDFIAAALAAHMVGATPQPLSVSLVPKELTDIVELSDPAIVVVREDGPRPGRPLVFVERVETRRDGGVPEEFFTTVAKEWKAPTSGGSTGRPKVIVSTAPALIDPEDPALESLTRLPVDSTVVIPGPLFHNGPFTFGIYALLRRNHLVLSSRFDARRTLEQVNRHHASYLFIVPTMMLRIARLPDKARTAHHLSTLTAVMHMGAPCAPWLKEVWMQWVGDDAVAELYGGTEQQANTVIVGSEWRTHRGSVGRTVAGQMKIVRDDGSDADVREIGEVYLNTGSPERVTYRYIGATPTRLPGGWETLGDLGWMDEEGYLYLVERRADLILRGGVNIYPAEVETALEEHPEVIDAVVVGIPDEDLGQAVHAIVHTVSSLTESQLIEHLAPRLSTSKRPQSFEFVTEPLRDDSGKVRRSKLREDTATSRHQQHTDMTTYTRGVSP